MNAYTRVLGAGLVLGAIGIAGPALAQSRVATDPAGDMTTFAATWPGPDGSTAISKTVPAPHHANGDLRQVRVKFGPRGVSVWSHLRQFHRTEPQETASWAAELRTFGGDQFSEYTLSLSLYGAGPVWSIESQVEDVGCAGARHGIDWETHNVWYFVPGRCLGSPKQVRFAVDTNDRLHRELSDGSSQDSYYGDTWPRQGFTGWLTPAAG